MCLDLIMEPCPITLFLNARLDLGEWVKMDRVIYYWELKWTRTLAETGSK